MHDTYSHIKYLLVGFFDAYATEQNVGYILLSIHRVLSTRFDKTQPCMLCSGLKLPAELAELVCVNTESSKKQRNPSALALSFSPTNL